MNRKRQGMLLTVASAALLLLEAVGVWVLSGAGTVMELYRIGFFGMSDSDGALLQLLGVPVAALLLSASVWSGKGGFRIPVTIAATAYAAVRAVAFFGIFSETDISKLLSGGFNTAMYVFMTVSSLFLAVSLFMSFFGGERFTRLRKKLVTFVSAVFAVFFLIVALFATIFVSSVTDGGQNLYLLSFSAAGDCLFFVIWLFVSRLQADAVLDDIIDFRDLMNRKTSEK